MPSILIHWRTSLLAVCLLLALLMFSQGKLTSAEFLGVLGFFNVAGYLLAGDAAASGPPTPPALVERVAAWVLAGAVLAVLGLSFYPLLKDAVLDRPRYYHQGEIPEAPNAFPGADGDSLTAHVKPLESLPQ